MDFLEFKGKTKNDAITEACRHFSIPSDKLEYEVIEEGSAGFLGFGSKPAVIKARVKEEETVETAVKEKVTAPVKEESAPVEKVKTVVETKPQPQAKEAVEVNPSEVENTAKKFLEDVFAAMKLEVVINVKYTADTRTLEVDLSGDEMGVLIGKRGQTLDSLQYLISLVVNNVLNFNI